MPKPSLHVLTWSEEHQQYELQSHDQPEQCFRPGDEPAFSCWLAEHRAFAFVGQAGRLSVIKEARPRGTGYWYAYRKQDHSASIHPNRLLIWCVIWCVAGEEWNSATGYALPGYRQFKRESMPPGGS